MNKEEFGLLVLITVMMCATIVKYLAIAGSIWKLSLRTFDEAIALAICAAVVELLQKLLERVIWKNK